MCCVKTEAFLLIVNATIGLVGIWLLWDRAVICMKFGEYMACDDAFRIFEADS